MAEGFARKLGARFGDIQSAALVGLSPVNALAIKVMGESGVDISNHYSTMISDFKPSDFDIVISMCGCGATVPDEWKEGKRFEDWNVKDPAGLEEPVFVTVRDEIAKRVDELIASHEENRPPTYSLYTVEDVCASVPGQH